MKPCDVENCETEIKWGTYCEKHRKRMKRHGDPTIALRMWKATRAERLDAYVDRTAGVDGCWPWTMTTNANGYGIISNADGGTAIASRAAYEEAHHVVLATDVDVMHLCNNPPCCNPEHLRAGSRAENQAYMATTGRSAHGSGNGNAKLTADDVELLIQLRASGAKIAELAATFGVSAAQVSRIANRRRWGHLPL